MIPTLATARPITVRRGSRWWPYLAPAWLVTFQGSKVPFVIYAEPVL